MGEDPEQYEAGDNCIVCWGLGKTWGDFPTPRFVFAWFDGIPAPHEAANGVYQLEQLAPAAPCTWQSILADYWAAWEVNIAWSRLSLTFQPGPEQLFFDQKGLCVTVFDDNGKIGIVY